MNQAGFGVTGAGLGFGAGRADEKEGEQGESGRGEILHGGYSVWIA